MRTMQRPQMRQWCALVGLKASQRPQMVSGWLGLPRATGRAWRGTAPGSENMTFRCEQTASATTRVKSTAWMSAQSPIETMKITTKSAKKRRDRVTAAITRPARSFRFIQTSEYSSVEKLGGSRHHQNGFERSFFSGFLGGWDTERGLAAWDGRSRGPGWDGRWLGLRSCARGDAALGAGRWSGESAGWRPLELETCPPVGSCASSGVCSFAGAPESFIAF
mmetsp:Transcript_12493/g.17404  ORF Transcript_12493/g.17404 Transcript_12493/m.17404 type:complete len:221 (-) Transcript_12493:133-795(-)